MMTPERWRLKGEYFENCNCEILCPCVLPVGSGAPTEGHCDVLFAFHIAEGDFSDISLEDLNVVLVCYTPSRMGEGNWTSALYIDERADQPQRAALGRIFSGEVGGAAERWMGLTTDFRGIKYAPITYHSEGRQRSVSISEIIDFNVEGVTAGNREVMRLENAGHPVNSTLAIARGSNSTYSDHGMSWDNTGKNAHYAPFEWSWSA
ncbi:MAG: DUF1326 domain-containing protein [Dehalococcoidia bacterium]